MPIKEQSKRYKKIINSGKKIVKKKEKQSLKNWQKIFIIGVLALLCIAAIIIISYLIIYK